VLIVGALTWLCYVGIKQSARANNAMVIIKVAIIVLFIVVGLSFIDTANWRPYLPANTGDFGHFGWSGVMQGAAIIFFAYIGFDTAATTAQEARNPQRDVPAGIIAALVISTVLYVVMAAVMTGMVSYEKLNVSAPVAVALDEHPSLFWLGLPVKIGAIVGMTSVILMSILGQPRIFMAMSRDGLLPPVLEKVHPRYRTPSVATLITGALAAIFAGAFPIDVLGELVSIGILLAFTAVCLGVLMLRRTMPETPRPFRVPFAPITCTAGVIVCLGSRSRCRGTRGSDCWCGRRSGSRSISATATGTAGCGHSRGADADGATAAPPGLRIGLGVAAAGRRATHVETREVERRGIREV